MNFILYNSTKNNVIKPLYSCEAQEKVFDFQSVREKYDPFQPTMATWFYRDVKHLN